MHFDPESRGRARWWLSAGATVFVHAIAVSGLAIVPDSARSPAPQHASVIWLSALSGASGGADESAATDGEQTAPASATSSPQSPATLVHPRLSARATEGALRRERSARSRRALASLDADMRSIQSATTPDLEARRSAALPSAASSDSLAPAAGAEGGAPPPAVASSAGARRDQASGGESGSAASRAGQSGPGSALGGAGRGAHGPGLLAMRDPCRGYFPSAASADHAEVQIRVRVDEGGHARASQVLAEHPRGQQFGRAAAACAAALRFVPAVDGLGMPIVGEAKLELRFDRT